jgi:hypothetical protein
MRWLILAFIVSLAALLAASAGVALHIRRDRALRHEPDFSAAALEEPEIEEAP